jgi:hypothetical protein
MIRNEITCENKWAEVVLEHIELRTALLAAWNRGVALVVC